MFEMWIKMILLLLLGVCALWDGIKKEIPLAVVWIGILAAVVLRLAGVMGEETWLSLGFSFLPGIFFWVLSFMTREKVGYGDGWVLLMIGLFIGFIKCFQVLLIGLAAESMILLVLLAFRKVHKDGEIPFVPFLLLGLGVVMCI